MTKVPFTRIDIVAATQPTGVSVTTGTLWFDSITSKLKIFDGATFQEYVQFTDMLGSNITLVDNFSFTNKTNLQEIMDDVNDNIYVPLVAEHDFITGEHGPKVNITQTAVDSALDISKTNVSGGNVVNITNAGIGHGINVSKTSTGAGNAITATNSGTGDGLSISQVGAGDAIGIVSGTASGDAIDITHGGVGKSVRIEHSGLDGAVHVRHSNATSIQSAIEVVSSSTGPGLLINQDGESRCIFVSKNSLGASPAIQIDNAGTGLDIRGNGNTWNVDNAGNATFNSISSTQGLSATRLSGIARWVGAASSVPPNGSWGDVPSLSTTFTAPQTGTVFATVAGLGIDNAAWRIVLDGVPISFAGTGSGNMGVVGTGALGGGPAQGNFTATVSGTFPFDITAGTRTVKVQATADPGNPASATVQVEDPGAAILFVWELS